MMNYIFIDFDGTIVSGSLKHYNCYKKIVSEYGGIPVSKEEYWNLKRNKIDRTVLLAKTKFGGSYEDYLKRWLELIESQEMLMYDELSIDNRQALVKLKEYTKQLILVTLRHNRENLFWQLEKLGIKQLFEDIIVVDGTICKNKYEAVKQMKPTQAIVIGDTEEDEMLSEKLGAEFIAVISGLRDKNYLNAKYYIMNLLDMFNLHITELLNCSNI